ncbi:MAG: NAD-dependent dehydratase [Euryarchaeota archaeon]|mgnify:CR=1 FL=1|nr:NAD-dependent dehydratase [Euryarchaeota archaeon]
MNLENLKDTNVLVTGADGFIPSFVCDRLVELGANVTALVRRTSSNYLKSILHLQDKIKIRWGDITDLPLLISETKENDIIYHLAAQSHVQYSLHNPAETYQTNTIGTMNVLEAARLNDVKRVVHAGSAEVYGKPETVPITEEHPLVPRSPYAAGKVASDRLMYSYYCTYDLPVVMSRFFGIYGPRQSIEKAIPKFILQIHNNIQPTIYGDGKQSRDYMYVTDAADAYARLGIADNVEGKVVNIGTGTEIDIATLAKSLIKLMKSNLEPIFSGKISDGEAGRLFCDPSNGMKTLDWKPTISFEEGLSKTIEYYLQNTYLFNYSKFTI